MTLSVLEEYKLLYLGNDAQSTGNHMRAFNLCRCQWPWTIL